MKLIDNEKKRKEKMMDEKTDEKIDLDRMKKDREKTNKGITRRLKR